MKAQAMRLVVCTAVTFYTLTCYAGVADSVRVLGTSSSQLRIQGRFEEAILEAKRDLEDAQRVHGPTSIYVAERLLELGRCYVSKHSRSEAAPILMRALSLYEMADEDKLRDGEACTLELLAELYDYEDQYALSEHYYKRCISVMDLAGWQDDVFRQFEMADALDGLANLHTQKEHFELALPLFLRAFAIREKAMAKSDLEVTASLDNLANLYELQEQPDQALLLYNQALAIYEKELGPNGLEVAAILEHLAHCHMAMSQDAQAEPLLLRSVSIKEKLFGSLYYEVKGSLRTLASCYLKQAKYTQAEAIYLRLLAAGKESFGSEADTEDLEGMAKLIGDRGQYEEAESLYWRAIAIYEENDESDYREVAACYYKLAGLNCCQGHFEQVRPIFERVMAKCTMDPEADRFDKASCQYAFARLYHDYAQYVDAEEIYKSALAQFEKALGKSSPQVTTVLKDLIKLYEETGRVRAAKALETRVRALALVQP